MFEVKGRLLDLIELVGTCSFIMSGKQLYI